MKPCSLLLAAVLLAGAAHGQIRLNPAEQQQMLAAHNNWRAEVGVGPLSWAPDLAEASLSWAGFLATGNACSMQHSRDRGNVGENLYWASALMWSNGRRDVQAVTPEAVVGSWGDEVADYDIQTNACRAGRMCGHYTQVVWRNTREVGCAAQICPNKEQIWVCRYRPAGNWVGQRPY